jgi:sorting nexin-4
MEDLNKFLRDAIDERDKIIRTGDANAGSSNPITHFINKKMDEFKGIDPEKAKKERLTKLENKIEELQKAVSLSKETTQQFNDRLVGEFDVMSSIKDKELSTYIKRYAERQVEYYETVGVERNVIYAFIHSFIY